VQLLASNSWRGQQALLAIIMPCCHSGALLWPVMPAELGIAQVTDLLAGLQATPTVL